MKAFAKAVADELNRARKLHPTKMPTFHDAAGKIREEYQEFWDEVKKKDAARSRVNLLEELIQTAAMCQRAAEDLGLIDDSHNL